MIATLERDIVDHRVPAAAACAPCLRRGFFVIDGQSTVRCGDQTWQAGPGTLALLSRNVPHGFGISQAAEAAPCSSTPPQASPSSSTTSEGCRPPEGDPQPAVHRGARDAPRPSRPGLRLHRRDDAARIDVVVDLPLAPGVPERFIVGKERAFLQWFYNQTFESGAIDPTTVAEVLRKISVSRRWSNTSPRTSTADGPAVRALRFRRNDPTRSSANSSTSPEPVTAQTGTPARRQRVRTRAGLREPAALSDGRRSSVAGWLASAGTGSASLRSMAPVL